MDGWMYRWVNR